MNNLNVRSFKQRYFHVSWKSLLNALDIPIASERSTGALYILSPFVAEKTASCRLVEKNSRFHDYSTSETGHKLSFVLLVQNRSRSITATSLANAAKVFDEANNKTP